MSGHQGPRAGELAAAAADRGGGGAQSEDSTVTRTPTSDGDATSGAVADCSMASDTGGSAGGGEDYNKLKYHSSKMDLNLKILRDQMANLTSSGSSLSRQMASMHRNIQGLKDEDDEAEDADSEYESEEDEARPGSVRDAVDTEDDVNKMSDFERDYSEPKFKRSLSGGSRGKRAAAAANGGGGPTAAAARQASVDSCADSDSECSQCLCCNSVASYSSTPWRYVSRGDGSVMDEDSDSSEYFTDESEYSTTSNLPSTDLHKRLSPFYCPSDQGETLPQGDDGRFADAEDHRTGGKDHPQTDTSEGPTKTSKAGGGSQAQKPVSGKLPSSKSEKLSSESDKPPTAAESENPSTAEGDAASPEGEEKVVKASSIIGMFKEQESKAKQQEVEKVAKARRVEELRRKNSEIRLKNEQKRKAELEAKLQDKTDSMKSSPIASENEDSEKVNVRERISNFGGQKKTKEGKNGSEESAKAKSTEIGTNTDPDSVQQMPDVIPDVAEGVDDQKAKPEVQPANKSHKSKTKVAKTTVEIPVSCLPEQVMHPVPGSPSGQPTMMTFQVRPGDVEAMGGPILVARSPKPKRKMSKTIVRLSSTDSSPASVSESTLVSDADTVRVGPSDKQSGGHSHHLCPHCHKKNKKSGESKRVVKVLQLQPVPEGPESLSPAAVSTILPSDAGQVYEQQQSGRVIKMIPSRRQHVVQRQESDGDGVVFRFNMGIPSNAPLQVGDLIRIPIQPQQQEVRSTQQLQPPQPQIRRISGGGGSGGGGLVIRTSGGGGQPRRQKEVITVRQSPGGGDIRVQPASGASSGGLTVHTSQPGVRVMPSEGGGVKLVFGS